MNQWIFISFLFLNFPIQLLAQNKNQSLLKMLTYNVALAHGYIAYSEARRAPLIQAIKDLNADLICLQEVWSEEDQKVFIDKLNYPHVASAFLSQKQAKNTPVCRLGDLFGENKLLSCYRKKCGEGTEDKLSSCMMEQCFAEWNFLASNQKECAQAFSAQAGHSPIIAFFNLFNPFWKTGLFIYEGSPGILLFSKIPFKQKSELDMKNDSTTTHRSAIITKIDWNTKEVVVGCTHLSAYLRNLPYSGHLISWANENKTQSSKLIQAASKMAGESSQFLMGDFNCGFSVQNLDSDLEESCRHILQSGYQDLISEEPTRCTYCSTNNLSKDKGNSLIDHIFTKHVSMKSIKKNIVLDQKVEIIVKDKKILTYLSDHYGVLFEWSGF